MNSPTFAERLRNIYFINSKEELLNAGSNKISDILRKIEYERTEYPEEVDSFYTSIFLYSVNLIANVMELPDTAPPKPNTTSNKPKLGDEENILDRPSNPTPEDQSKNLKNIPNNTPNNTVYEEKILKTKEDAESFAKSLLD